MHARNIALHAWCMVRMAHGMPVVAYFAIVPFLVPAADGSGRTAELHPAAGRLPEPGALNL
jgi:hypothetical protein